jgi:hypothetical protein
MKSRGSFETFVGKDLQDIRKIRGDIDDLEKDVKKTNKSSNDGITDLRNKKLDVSEFDNTLSSNAKFQAKLDRNDFDSALSGNPKFQAKLDRNDFDGALSSSSMFQSKLDKSEFGNTLSKDQTIVKLQNDLKSVPTSDNIGAVVSEQVNSRVGNINAAKDNLDRAYAVYDTNLSNSYGQYDVSLGRAYDKYQKNLLGRFDYYGSSLNDTTASSLNAINNSAEVKLTLLDSKWGSISPKMDNLVTNAGVSADKAYKSQILAENAQYKTQKMYNDVFSQVSGQIITDQGLMRDNLSQNSNTGFFETTNSTTNGNSSTSSGTTNGNSSTSNDTINGNSSTSNGMITFPAKDITILEKFSFKPSFGEAFTLNDSITGRDIRLKKVIEDVNDFNAKYYEYNNCVNGLCPTNKPLSLLESELNTAASNLNISTTDALNNYQSTGAVDNTQSIIDQSRELDELRRDLDTKMEAIVKSKNRIDEPSIEYDSTVYAGILWSILGTSLLFYVFTE